MEDLWSSPWASDLPPAKLDAREYPSAPQTVHFSVPQHSLPRKISQTLSPWHDDNAWGDDQHAGRKRVPSWRRSSPGLKAVDEPPRLKREPSPDPWKALENLHFETRANAGESSQERQGIRDSGVVVEDKVEATIFEEEKKQAPATTTLEMQDDGRGADVDAPHVSGEPEPGSGPNTEAEVVEVEPEEDEEQTQASSRTESEGELENSSLSSGASCQSFGREVEAEASVSKEDPETSQAAKPETLFPIDFAALDHLFPTTGPVDTEPEPVPDVIIDDTFTTISERKTWYRISRFGSSRKHDSGEDENYVRASWAGSKVRDQTLKTVRRWAEDDSIAGRVFRGGRLGASGSSMFHWDSKAPPVEIGQLLEERSKSAQHARHTSLVPAATTPSEDLGWTDGSPSSPATAKPKQRPLSMGHFPSMSMPNHWVDPAPPLKTPPLHFSPMPFPPMKTSPVRPSNLKNVETVEVEDEGVQEKEQEEDDDDDEWGEMVGTPAVEDVGDVFGPLSETARASLESVKGDVFDGESPPEKGTGQERILDQPTSASTLWDISHFDDNRSPDAPSPGGLASFPFPGGYVTPPITPSPPNAAPAMSMASLTEGLSLDDSYRKASLAQAIAMSSPATSVSDREVEMEKPKEVEDDADAIAADIIRGLPDLTYMLR